MPGPRGRRSGVDASAGRGRAGQPSRRAFRANSLASTYPLVGRFDGTVEVAPDSVIVDFDSAVVRSAIPQGAALNPSLLKVAVRLGVAADSGTGWAAVARGPVVPLLDSLPPDADLRLRPFRLAVVRPRDRRAPADFLFVELSAVHLGLGGRPPGPLAAYACEEVSVTGDSATARAGRMRMRYAIGC